MKPPIAVFLAHSRVIRGGSGELPLAGDQVAAEHWNKEFAAAPETL
jgi:hypothetical protein